MKKIGICFAFALAATVVPFSPACADQTMVGKVIRVADGDTVTLRSQGKNYKIRLSGIDAPESKMPFGNASRRSLDELLKACGYQASVRWKKKDRYGRIVGILYACGSDTGLKQLEQGMAWYYRHYKRELPTQTQRQYDRAEQQARQARRGLWQEPSPTAPWQWRKARRHK